MSRVQESNYLIDNTVNNTFNVTSKSQQASKRENAKIIFRERPEPKAQTAEAPAIVER